MREKIKKSDNLHRYENPEDTRDWDLNFLIATLGEFDSRGIDGRLFWQDWGVDYQDGQINLSSSSDLEVMDMIYKIIGYCELNDITYVFTGEN